MDRTLSVRLPEALLERLNVAAAREDRSRSSVVRRALEAALEVPDVVRNERTGEGSDPRQARSMGVPHGDTLAPPGEVRKEWGAERPSANFGSHERYGPRKPRGKPFQKS